MINLGEKLRAVTGRKDRRLVRDRCQIIEQNVIVVRNIECLRIAMGWAHAPVIDHAEIDRFEYLEDLNHRRLRDAEVLGSACCNGDPEIILEIGTSIGNGTALIAQNAPDALVYTVNIPPEEITSGGSFVTHAPSRDEIGRYYREKGCKNVRQIFANTARWEPEFFPIDVAFIDGCHDADFVFNDTRKVLQKCKPGSIILWHDFCPALIPVYPWIADVCLGVSRLYAEGLLSGKILHLQDSWVGLYRHE